MSCLQLFLSIASQTWHCFPHIVPKGECLTSNGQTPYQLSQICTMSRRLCYLCKEAHQAGPGNPQLHQPKAALTEHRPEVSSFMRNNMNSCLIVDRQMTLGTGLSMTKLTIGMEDSVAEIGGSSLGSPGAPVPALNSFSHAQS